MSLLLQRARELRKNSTDVERLLWKHLRAKRLAPYKFKRQEPIGSHIVDFVCYELRLIIELDGGQHADQHEYDGKRTAWPESQGFVMLRFWNNDVTENLEGVVQRILECLGASSLSPGSSPVKGERRTT
jgi:very-short-patch-repair endonuclease